MNCILCDQQVKVSCIDGSLDQVIQCNNCGNYIQLHDDRYLVEKLFSQNEKMRNGKHLISGFITEQNEKGNQYYKIGVDSIKNIYASGQLPQTILEKIEKLIVKLYTKTTYLYQPIEIDQNKPSIAYAVNVEEFSNIISYLLGRDLLEADQSGTPISVHLTMNGIDYAEKISKKAVDSKQCFVAMWFSDDMMQVFQNTISRAVDECGYKALIISMKEHNENINDYIISEIRKSKFVIADFTGNRGGVYFESGFALGLNKQVIWTCRKDHFNT